MKQTWRVTQQLAANQEQALVARGMRAIEDEQRLNAIRRRTTGAGQAVRYRLYTENAANLPKLVARYFDGATIYDGLGLWQGEQEQSAVIEVIASRADLQQILNLAGDIRVTNRQQSVLVTWENVSRFDLDETAINQSAL